jgi:hypothetical protein
MALVAPVLSQINLDDVKGPQQGRCHFQDLQLSQKPAGTLVVAGTKLDSLGS